MSPQLYQLFPVLTAFRVLQVVRHETCGRYGRIELYLEAKARTATCPWCCTGAQRVHSWYWRTLADLSISGTPVAVHLHVRRFVCGGQDCARRIFAERFGELVAPYGRQSKRLIAALQRIGLEVGGQAGARLARDLALPTSSRTLLRRLHALPQPIFPTPRVLGVDEWG